MREVNTRASHARETKDRGSPGFSDVAGGIYAAWMLLACCLPLLPIVTSKETFWPSASVLKPGMLMDEKWAKRSAPPRPV